MATIPPEEARGSFPREDATRQEGTPRRKGRLGLWLAIGAAVFFFLCTVVLFFLWLLTAVGMVLAVGGGGAGRGPIKRTLVEGGPAQVLIVPVEGLISAEDVKGVIGGSPGLVEQVRRQLDAAAKDDAIKAVVLRINSPGGTITACDDIHRLVTRFRERGKPVVAYLDEVAASGGYYVACAADVLVAHPLGITGSIGVIMPRVEFEGLLQKLGVKVDPIKSAEGKDLGAGYRPLADEERRLLQGIVDEMHRRFCSVVRAAMERRGVRLSDEEFDRTANGHVFTGEAARARGLVDATGHLDDAVARAEALAGIRNATVVQYRRPEGILAALAGASAPFQTPHSVAERKALERGAVRLMYLWTFGAMGDSVEAVAERSAE